MLFKVEMTVGLPTSLPPAAAFKAGERAVAQDLRRQGRGHHLWRVAGRRANVSIFDADRVEQLHQRLSGRPLFPDMDITGVSACRHPWSVHDDDR